MHRDLVPHPDCKPGAVERIGVALSRSGQTLRLDYEISGNIAALRLPAVEPAGRAHELWKHTCFEAFVRPLPGPAYCEFNFAPSTRWAAYRFDAYRDGMRDADAAPRIAVTRNGQRFTLRAELAVPEGALRLGLSAVIEERDGARSYWALAHRQGKPDFHHSDCFALEVPAA